MVRISEAYRRPCSRNLHDFLEETVGILERNQEIDISRREKTLLLQMSHATIDRRLRPFRERREDFRRRQTKPGSRLCRKIPQRTSADWEDPPPGFLEIDLVSHGGGRSDGEFIHTLNVVDIATRWYDFERIANRGERVTLAALETIRARLPFPLQEIDSDNDSAFINNHLYRFWPAAVGRPVLRPLLCLPSTSSGQASPTGGGEPVSRAGSGPPAQRNRERWALPPGKHGRPIWEVDGAGWLALEMHVMLSRIAYLASGERAWAMR